MCSEKEIVGAQTSVHKAAAYPGAFNQRVETSHRTNGVVLGKKKEEKRKQELTDRFESIEVTISSHLNTACEHSNKFK